MGAILFITGTDTGAGKTVLTTLLLRHARRSGCHALAMKPFCSGGLNDAHLLALAQDREIPIERISPFRFRLPVSPLLAARRSNRRVTLATALNSLHSLASECELLFVEGAGGLLSPLGEAFTARELIAALRCPVIIAAQNKLGAINHALLTVSVLRPLRLSSCKIVLMNNSQRNVATRTNAHLIQEFGNESVVFEIPFLRGDPCRPIYAGRFKEVLGRILGDIIPLPASRKSTPTKAAPHRRKNFACTK